jgi:PTH1 family peptidyl-tRNA hydrolase
MGRTSIHGQSVWLLEPQTFMNLSGKSVARWRASSRSSPRKSWSCTTSWTSSPAWSSSSSAAAMAATRLRDIHAQLGSPNYWRLRVGIGHPGHKGEVASWVLKKPAPDQRKLIEDAIAHSLKAWPGMVAGQMDKATLAIHTTKPPRPKPPRPAAAA